MMSKKSSSETTKTTFLIVSDLHASDGDIYKDYSHLTFNNEESAFGTSFLKKASEIENKIDYIICAGDISTKSCISSFKKGWGFLHKLKEATSAKELYSVPGNHDHQSRKDENTFSPKHNLQFIKPFFPTNNYSSNTHFWAWNWCLNEEENFNIILLNSSAYHGFDDEYKKGRVALETAEQIREALKSASEKPFNILVCHHHITKMDHIDNARDTEAMDGSEHLIRELDRANKGPWLIIHGHKHFANIYKPTSTFSTENIVFSAGSLSAKLHEQIMHRTSNQFYIIEIDNKECSNSFSLKGKYWTYEYAIGRGWDASTSYNLPAYGLFGYQANQREIFHFLKTSLEDSPFLTHLELSEINNKTKALLPDSFNLFLKMISDHGYKYELSNTGRELVEVIKDE